MLRIKVTIFFIISCVIIISDLIITPYRLTYAFRPILAFVGIIFVSYLDIKMAESSMTIKERRAFYYSVIVIFFIGLILNIAGKSHIPTFPFVVGCTLQSFVFLRALKRVGKGADAGGIKLYEAPLPNIGYMIMSGILFIRDLFMNHVKHLESVGIKEGDHVLDFGCGPGAFTFAASKIVGASGVVYALDNQHLSVEAIEKKAGLRGISNIKTIYSNQNETGLADRSVDYVLLIGVLHLVRDTEKLLTELKRVLKDEGRLIVVPVHIPRKDLHKILTPYFKFTDKVGVVDILVKPKAL